MEILQRIQKMAHPETWRFVGGVFLGACVAEGWMAWKYLERVGGLIEAALAFLLLCGLMLTLPKSQRDEVFIFEGPQRAGKSTLALQMAQRMADPDFYSPEYMAFRMEHFAQLVKEAKASGIISEKEPMERETEVQPDCEQCFTDEEDGVVFYCSKHRTYKNGKVVALREAEGGAK